MTEWGVKVGPDPPVQHFSDASPSEMLADRHCGRLETAHCCSDGYDGTKDSAQEMVRPLRR